jgi:hypothetical protein
MDNFRFDVLYFCFCNVLTAIQTPRYKGHIVRISKVFVFFPGGKYWQRKSNLKTRDSKCVKLVSVGKELKVLFCA